MPLKTLKWWVAEWDRACALAALYGCSLDLDQFCCCRGIEEEERDQLLAYFLRSGTITE